MLIHDHVSKDLIMKSKFIVYVYIVRYDYSSSLYAKLKGVKKSIFYEIIFNKINSDFKVL